jgi:GT2 family glycosyltransferase/tetratricopeptide (TPR) repeat protein
MDVRKVAVIFDNKARPDTTGVYCRRALGKLADVEHFLPTEFSRIPRGAFDLYLNIDDGLEYRLPVDLHPCAFWAIDTHLNLPWYVEKGPEFDLVFTAQRDGAEQLRAAGITSAAWLPLACDPEIHAKHDMPKTIDICFVGNVFPGRREEFLDLIRRRFRNSFVGQRFFEEMAKTYSAAKLVFNASLRNDINMRVFEALACGSLLITNDLRDNGQEELFRDGIHLATYSDAEDLFDKIAYYLRKDELRERIAAKGRSEALAHHTYLHRMQQVLNAAGRIQSSSVSAPTANYGTTSIVILTHDELSFTRSCVESIHRHTREPYELIFVDNASSDGTREYLQSLPDARVIRNDTNRGFPAGCNQGIQAASGRQILLLNNDTLATPGWLTRLLAALHSDSKMGLVGPCSNYVGSEQQIDVRYDDLSQLESFARDWGKQHESERVETDRLIGFCLLIRREVIETIGLLDERFGMGCYEDDDFCRRAIQAGFRAVIARDAFVHHFGSRTFMATGVDFRALMERNRQIFEEKWSGESSRPSAITGSEPVSASRLHPFSLVKSLAGGLLLRRSQPEISLCMIARDNETTIGAALESIKPWVDEMIVVDTGSKDNTPGIAKRLGARVFRFAWCDDFSAARNESLRHAASRWIFWMDSDDTIDASNGRGLRRLVRQAADSTILGFVVQVHCPGRGPDGDMDVTVVDHVKLFRNLPGMCFDGRIHEQILPAIRRLEGEVAWSDVYVTHSGYDHSATGQEKKKERDLKLLHLEEKERPKHPFTLFNLGMTYNDIGEYEKAIGYLERSIQQSGREETHLRKAYALLIYAHSRLGNREAAWDCCERAVRLFPEDVELRFRRALLLHELGRLEESARLYQAVLAEKGERHFNSIDKGIRSFKARQNLAAVYTDMGEYERAEEQWRLITEEVPNYRPGWRGLGENLLRKGKVKEAAELAARLEKQDRLRSIAILLQAEILESEGNSRCAKDAFEHAVRQYSGDSDAWQSWCRFLFEHGDKDQAESALKRLVELEPTDAAAYHNLGTVYLQTKRYPEAIEAYRESLKHRPRAAQTYHHLGHAYAWAGDISLAHDAYVKSIEIDPTDAEALRALNRLRCDLETADSATTPRG